MFIGMLCGGALWPLITLFLVWADDAHVTGGPLMVLVALMGALSTLLGMPAAFVGRGYAGFALVVLIWGAVGAMAARAWHDRHERKRSV